MTNDTSGTDGGAAQSPSAVETDAGGSAARRDTPAMARQRRIQRVWRALTFGVFGSKTPRGGYREISKVLNTLRAPLLVSLLAVAAFGFPGQVYEIYRLFAEDFDFSSGFSWAQLRFASFFVMLYLVTFVLWYVARVLTLTDPHCRRALGQREADGVVARWGPRVVGAAPAFAASFGMARAEFLREGGTSTPGLYGAAAIAFLIGALRLYATWRRAQRRPESYADLERTAFRYDVRILAGIVILAGVAYLTTQPILVAQRLGTLSIFGFFLIALVFIYAQLTFLYDRYAIPIVTVLVGGLILFAALDLNDNHFLRELETSEQNVAGRLDAPPSDDAMGMFPPIPTSIGDTFRDWYNARADRQAYRDAGRPYPVFVVAAQGGGIYAAYQSAVFMAMLQDVCPGFAQHLYGVSGVSGGSVGAVVYTALAETFAENRPIDRIEQVCSLRADRQRIAARAHRMLSQDFLSPLVTGLLFSDFTARFLPAPVPAFDRARALERALEQSWEQAFRFPFLERRLRRLQAAGDPRAARIAAFLEEQSRPRPNPLERGVLSYWRPDGVAPALFLNTTEAETGRRLVFSPIADLSGVRSYLTFARRGARDLPPDVRLSTAAMVSARFPFFTPAASMRLRAFDEQEGAFSKLRLVDGGYFENSGVETALTVIEAIRGVEGLDNEIDVRLIVFDLTRDEFRDATYAFGELLSPLKTIVNATVARSELAQARARGVLDAPCRYVSLDGRTIPGASETDAFARACPPERVREGRVWSVSLNDYEYDFQLGWILSNDTLGRIRDQLGDARLCLLEGETSPPAHLLRGGGGVTGEGRRTPLLTDEQRAELRQIRDARDRRLQRLADDAVARHNSCVSRFVIETLTGR